MNAVFVEIPAPAPVTAPPAAQRPAPLKRLLRAAPPYLYLAPGLVLLIIWTYRPLLQTAQLSFFSWNLLPTSPMVPVGTANYEQLLGAPELGNAVWNTVLVIAGLLPFTVVIPVVVALLTRQVGGRLRELHRALIFAPMLVAPVASAAVWQWLLDPRSGAVNRLLGTEVNWLNESAPAMVSIIGITGWHLLGFAVLLVSAGLAGINDDYAAAAQLDGASRWQVTRWITLPLLSPTLVFLVLMTVLLGAQWTFPLIDTLTQGGPAAATTHIYYLLWDYGFHSHQAGLGAAAGVIFFAVFGVVALFLVWLADRISFHDD
ncbi:sugar ABC transporter permease [Saccharopolyspora indica]|uniref:carbohydrate ABC transporter permease n=1 Tax=Saccharopolyspora indica TaxID=1229659 RepID=UPI0022EAD8B7|nr:sugar ABC transporter permease [Saccharopolyspora indica]MDA3648395.1 sugar ABC transporter permease [Saccharopolyspora indica]